MQVPSKAIGMAFSCLRPLFCCILYDIELLCAARALRSIRGYFDIALCAPQFKQQILKDEISIFWQVSLRGRLGSFCF
jgi:hypothetical protein